MAYEQNQLTLSAIATSDLSAKQFYAVTMTTTAGKIDVATATKNMDGILLNKPTALQTAQYCYDGICKAAITASSNVAVGGLLEVDTAGTLKALASGTAVAKALEATNVATVNLIRVELLRSNAAFV